MSDVVFTWPPGATWPQKRKPVFSTTVQRSVSGRRTRMANQAFPTWQYDIPVEYLLATVNGNANIGGDDLRTLLGTFLARQGQVDSLLLQDPDDNQVQGQLLGVGDGATLTFQLIRSYGGFFGEPIYAPNVVATVYVNGAAVPGANWSVSNWGAAAPGVITFTAGNAPGADQPVAADFSYYWPATFAADALEVERFASGFYEAKSVTFETLNQTS